MNRVVALLVVFGLGGCSSFQRMPSSDEGGNSWAPAQNLQRFTQSVQSSDYNMQTCAKILTSIQQQYASIAWDHYSNAELANSAKKSIETSWNLRSAIHQKLSSSSRECALLARDVFHRGRDFEDFLGEFAYPQKPLQSENVDFQKQPIPILDRGGYPPYFVRPDSDSTMFNFRAGDLMLARGISYVSAVISQVSDNRSHYSHVVMLSPDPTTQKLGTVESYIGVGVKPYELDFALRNENARLLVLRPKDSALGAEAARYAAQAARSNIPYDYSSDFSDYSKMSCVEVAVASYDKASNGEVKLPSIPAHININNSKFLTQMNIRTGEIVTPDDLEIDPNFEMVLDWKDYRLVRDSRQKDALLSEMMRWVSDLKYGFHDDLLSLAAKDIVFPARRTPLWPLIRKLTKSPNIDRGVPRKTLGLMKVLSDTGDILLKELRAQDAAYFQKYQRPMTNQQLRAVLEQYRQQDLEIYRRDGKSPLHSLLRPEHF